MAQPWPYSLYELGPFSGLQAVGLQFGIRFRLFGGTASRLAMALWHDRRLARTLVDLCPFSSDIDLQHSGDDELNEQVASAIDALVPEAFWCRWSLVGRQKSKILQTRREASTYIPLRGIVFDSWRAAPVDQRALEDLEKVHVSLTPYEAFAESPARLAGGDLEIFGVLVALAAAADLAFASGSTVTIDGGAVREILARYVNSDDAEVLAGSFLLRRRLYYLTAAVAARTPLPDGLAREVLELLARVGALAELPPHGRALVVSAALDDDDFRADRTIDLSTSRDDFNNFRESLGADYRVDPVYDFSGVSGGLKLRPGHAPSSGIALDSTRREFLHLAWRADAQSPSVTTGFCLGPAGDVHVGAAVGGSLPGGCWLRIDIGSAIGTAKDQRVRIGILQARTADETDTEKAPMPGVGRPGDPVEIEREVQVEEAFGPRYLTSVADEPVGA